MSIKRIYISGPITGNPEAEQEFAEAEELLSKGGNEVINPYKFNSVMPASSTHEDYMKVCLAALACCDTVVMLPGWGLSKGAKQEHTQALERGLSVFEYKEILKAVDIVSDIWRDLTNIISDISEGLIKIFREKFEVRIKSNPDNWYPVGEINWNTKTVQIIEKPNVTNTVGFDFVLEWHTVSTNE